MSNLRNAHEVKLKESELRASEKLNLEHTRLDESQLEAKRLSLELRKISMTASEQEKTLREQANSTLKQHEITCSRLKDELDAARSGREELNDKYVADLQNLREGMELEVKRAREHEASEVDSMMSDSNKKHEAAQAEKSRILNEASELASKFESFKQRAACELTAAAVSAEEHVSVVKQRAAEELHTEASSVERLTAEANELSSKLELARIDAHQDREKWASDVDALNDTHRGELKMLMDRIEALQYNLKSEAAVVADCKDSEVETRNASERRVELVLNELKEETRCHQDELTRVAHASEEELSVASSARYQEVRSVREDCQSELQVEHEELSRLRAELDKIAASEAEAMRKASTTISDVQAASEESLARAHAVASEDLAANIERVENVAREQLEELSSTLSELQASSSVEQGTWSVELESARNEASQLAQAMNKEVNLMQSTIDELRQQQSGEANIALETRDEEVCLVKEHEAEQLANLQTKMQAELDASTEQARQLSAEIQAALVAKDTCEQRAQQDLLDARKSTEEKCALLERGAAQTLQAELESLERAKLHEDECAAKLQLHQNERNEDKERWAEELKASLQEAGDARSLRAELETARSDMEATASTAAVARRRANDAINAAVEAERRCTLAEKNLEELQENSASELKDLKEAHTKAELLAETESRVAHEWSEERSVLLMRLREEESSVSALQGLSLFPASQGFPPFPRRQGAAHGTGRFGRLASGMERPSLGVVRSSAARDLELGSSGKRRRLASEAEPTAAEAKPDASAAAAAQQRAGALAEATKALVDAERRAAEVSQEASATLAVPTASAVGKQLGVRRPGVSHSQMIPPSRGLWGIAAKEPVHRGMRSMQPGVSATRGVDGKAVLFGKAQTAEAFEASQDASERARWELERCVDASVVAATVDASLRDQAEEDANDAAVLAMSQSVVMGSQGEQGSSAGKSTGVAVLHIVGNDTEGGRDTGAGAILAEIASLGHARQRLQLTIADVRDTLDRSRRAAIEESQLRETTQEIEKLSQRLRALQAETGTREPEDVIRALRAATGAWSERRRQCYAALRGIQELRRCTLGRLIEEYEVITDEAEGLGAPEDVALLAAGIL
eukprot:TRINITY_DN8062_c0_g4_i1.p1 TRINITY_DN8062_c0_g4~~TRINITY_DN8062_c0_g4_i1.p1  ORF type:complete len:1237 (+),score=306.82 TRINITY_DN8062_c0_g4_i1:394-3711(+)